MAVGVTITVCVSGLRVDLTYTVIGWVSATFYEFFDVYVPGGFVLVQDVSI